MTRKRLAASAFACTALLTLAAGLALAQGEGPPPAPLFTGDPPEQPILSAKGDMVLVPPGTFWAACPSFGLTHCEWREVSVGSFWIDRTEVTVGAYRACVKAGQCPEPVDLKATGCGCNKDLGCNFAKRDREEHPVNCVTWPEASSYCAWAGKRLPTSQEWAKAARGTDGRMYPWGDEPESCEYAVFESGGAGCGRNSTWPVGSKARGASPYGALDMAGNVVEWVSDWEEKWNGHFVQERPGGSWRTDGLSWTLRLLRSDMEPSFSDSGLGFRCAKDDG